MDYKILGKLSLSTKKTKTSDTEMKMYHSMK